MGTIKELIRYMLDAHNAYNGTGMMMALYFVALMIIVFYCKDKHVKKAIILPSVLFIIVMYVGVPLYDTLVAYLKFYDGRMFWMLITPIIISIGFTYFVMGIDDDKLKHIFEPFYSANDNVRSSGLGLAIVSDLIEKMHGRISVKSKVGKGTEFTITIPITVK